MDNEIKQEIRVLQMRVLQLTSIVLVSAALLLLVISATMETSGGALLALLFGTGLGVLSFVPGAKVSDMCGDSGVFLRVFERLPGWREAPEIDFSVLGWGEKHE